MESDKVWLLLCKPCSVRVQKLPDSVINKWRKRTSLHHRPYPSRKRAADTEIHNCRLLRPRRKLMYSQDAINCIPFLFDDEDYDDDDKDVKVKNDEQVPESEIPPILPKIDEDDNAIPAWKYKRKLRKLSDPSNDEIDVVNHQSSIQDVLQDLKSNEQDKSNIQIQSKKEAKLILWRLEDLDLDDPYLRAWKSKNNLLNKNHVQTPLCEEIPQQNKENEDIPEQIEESEDIPKQIEENRDIPKKNQENKNTPKINKQNKNSGKSKKKGKLVPKSTKLNCSMCYIEFQTKEELSDHIYSHTPTDLQKTYAEAVIEGSSTKDKADNHVLENLYEEELINIDSNNTSTVEQLAIVTENITELSVAEIIPDINVNIILDDSSQIAVCSCHSENRSQNDYSVQIEMVLYCEICNILFRRSECFEVHYRYNPKCNQERGKGRLPKLFCSTCRLILNTLSDMRKHLEEHANINFHGTVTFVCNICRVVFFGVGTVFCTHWFTHERDPTFVASRYSFPKLCVSNQGIKPAGATPVEQYLFVAEYVCRICKQQFSSESELTKHSENNGCTKSQENIENQTKTPEKQKTTSPRSKESDDTPIIISESIEQDNINIFRLISKWDCGFCNKQFSTWSKFEEHSVDHLQVIGYPGYLCRFKQNSPPTYICNICRRLCNSLPDLMKHWTSHDIIKFTCTYCNEKHSSLKSFISHVRRTCWKFKPGCMVILNNQRPSCRICKTAFESFEEMIQHDHREHKTDNSAKKNTEEAKTVSKKQPQHIVISESLSKSTESVSLNLSDTSTFNLHVNRPTVISGQKRQSTAIQSTLNTSNAAGKIINSKSLEQQMNLSNNQIIHPASSNTSLQKNTPTGHVKDGPVQLVSLIVDKSGNIQVVPNTSGIRIATASDSTFQGSQVITKSMPLLNDSNEIIMTNSVGINGPMAFVLPKNSTSLNTFNTVNNVQNINSNNKNTSIIEQTRLITPTVNTENRRIQETVSNVRSQEKVVNNSGDIECSNTITQSPSKVTEENENETRILTDNSSDPIIVDSSSSDQDSEILVEKVCLSPEKRPEADTSPAANTSRTADDEVKIIGTSPSKVISKPRPFLRVKNFSELQAVKNYICKQCRAAFDNETSLNEHLFAHMNSLSRKGGNPTMRAALVLPATEVNSSESSTQQITTNVASNITGRRILPAIPQRVQGANSRIAIPLVNCNSTDERVVNQSTPTQITTEFSCPLCIYRCNKEEELRQHLMIHCQERLNNTPNVPTVVSHSQTAPVTLNCPELLSHLLLSSTTTSAVAAASATDVSKERSKIYNCKLCPFTTTEKKNIIGHVGIHCIREPQATTNVQNHNEPVQPSVPYPNVDINTATPIRPVYSCPTCINFQTTSCEELNQHIRDTHLISQELNNLYCRKCQLYFNSEATLKNHMNTYHMNFCKVCLRRFDDYNDFLHHLCCPQKAGRNETNRY